MRVAPKRGHNPSQGWGCGRCSAPTDERPNRAGYSPGMPIGEPIDSGVDIGHVHLKVADIDRALGVLARRARVRGDDALRRPGRVPERRRLPPPPRAQHLGEQGRLAAAARDDRALPRGDPLPDPRGARRRAATAARRRDPPRRRDRPRRQRGALPPRPGRERRRALLGSPAATSGPRPPTAATGSTCTRGRSTCRACSRSRG